MKGKQTIAAPALTVGRLLTYLQRLVESHPERATCPVWLSVVPKLNQWDKAKHVMTWNAHGDILLASDTQQDIERYANRLAK